MANLGDTVRTALDWLGVHMLRVGIVGTGIVGVLLALALGLGRPWLLDQGFEALRAWQDGR